MPDIGFPAFITDNPVLDSRGLTDRAIARSLYYGQRGDYAERTNYWDSQVTDSLKKNPPCAVNLLPKIYYLAERYFVANMIEDYIKIDKRTYVRKPGKKLPIATRVKNWENAWSRMPRSMLVTSYYIATLAEAGDVDALDGLEAYYSRTPRLFDQVAPRLKKARRSISFD